MRTSDLRYYSRTVAYCTLVFCKPQIRRSARPGDWIVALSPKQHGNKVVYAMHVAEKLSFGDYWPDLLFADKNPNLRAADPTRHTEDNIYEPLGDGDYRQLPSAHTTADQDRDLGGEYVLMATGDGQPNAQRRVRSSPWRRKDPDAHGRAARPLRRLL